MVVETASCVIDGRSRQRLVTDKKIQAAVRAVLKESGPGAVTMERVAEAAGIGRPTLYRRYRNRYELLESAAESIAPSIPDEPEVSLGGLTRLLAGFQRAFAVSGVRQLVAQIVGADAELLTTWRERFIGHRMAPLDNFLALGVEEGVLRGEAVDGTILELVVGAVLAGNLLHGELPENWASDLAEHLWRMIAV